MSYHAILKQNYKLVTWLPKLFFTKKPYESPHRVTKKQLSNSKRLRNSILPLKNPTFMKKGDQVINKMTGFGTTLVSMITEQNQKDIFSFYAI